MLRAVATARGWAVANGLPDEARAGRTLLKDYTAGKLLFAELPPGFQPQPGVPLTGHKDFLQFTR